MKKQNGQFNGNYVASASFLHKLDPRTKLIGFIFIASSLMLFKSFFVILLTGLSGAVLCLLSKISIKDSFKIVAGFYWLLLFSFVFHIFSLTNSGFSEEGFYRGGLVFLALAVNIFFAVLLTSSTHPSELAAALERFLRPFGFLMPVKKISFVFELSIHLVPEVFSESKKAVSKLKPKLDATTFYEKIKAGQETAAFFFLNSFKLADELAGKIAEGRILPNDKGITFKKRDIAAFLIMFVFSFVMFEIERTLN